MDAYDILTSLSVVNRDNGKRFTVTDRLDSICSLLWNTRYRRINSDGLFNLYSGKSLDKIDGDVVIVSSHVDCVDDIKHCFTRKEDSGLLLGTYDNAITNAAILTAMIDGNLPDNVLVCFTGDEECESRGADDLIDFMRKQGISVKTVVVLDVTDMGWKEEADYTIENDLWNDDIGKKAISSVESMGAHWLFVPSDVDDIPHYVENERVIMEEAEADESWKYDELSIPCFSLCLPIYGEMHSDRGVYAREESFYKYIQILERMLEDLDNM